MMPPIQISVGRDYNAAAVARHEFKDFDALTAFIREQQPHGGNCGPYLCAPMVNGHRNERFAQPTSIVLPDFDALPPDAPRKLCQAITEAGWRAALWTTRRSTPEAPRVRIACELDRAVDKLEYAAVYRAFARHLGEMTGLPLEADPSCAKPEQPAVLPQPASSLWIRAEGVPLNVDAYLAFDPGTSSHEREEDQADDERPDDRTREGGRNEMLSRLAFKLRKAGLEVDEIEAALQEANRRRCAPPLPEDEVRTIARGKGGIAPDEDVAHQEPGKHQFNPAAAALRADLIARPPPPPEFVIERILPADVGVRAAAGGTVKTTLELYEAIHIILGRDLYGFKIHKSGPVVIVTAEDEKVRLEWRLVQLVNALGLTPDERAEVLAKLHIEDLSDRPRRLVDQIAHSQSLIITSVVDEFIEAYDKVRPVLTVFDPQTYFGPGERFVNDGEALVMSAGRRIAKAWGGAVRFDHHTGKVQFRDGRVDMYAGRGGSAGADNARFVHVIVPHEKDDNVHQAPVSVAPEDIAARRLLRLHIPKVSHGPPLDAPIWLLRRDWDFTRILPSAQDPAEIERSELRDLYYFIKRQGESRIRHTARTLENHLKEIGVGRNRLRALIHIALERKHLIELAAVPSEKRGARKSYITVGTAP